jgi:hypothetical protein
MSEPAPAAFPPPYVCEDGLLGGGLPRPLGGADAGLGSLFGGTPSDAFGAGGLGMSGTGAGSGDVVDGGWGEGLGLGKIGAMGHGAGTGSGLGFGGTGPGPTPGKDASHVTGRLLLPADEKGFAAAQVLCAAAPAMRACAEAASTAAPVTGTAKLTLALRADGSIEKLTITLPDAPKPLVACLERTLDGKTFAAATPSLVYDLELVRRPPMVKMFESDLRVSGKLPRVVVQRILRAHFPRLRACYETLRKSDPSAEGTISTALVIDETGAVSSAKSEGSLTDATMRSCVQKVVSSVSFAEPEAGKVDVTYSVGFAY